MNYPNLKVWLAGQPLGSTPVQLYEAIQALEPMAVDVAISDIEGYMRARELVYTMQKWLDANPSSPAAPAASELLGSIISPHLDVIQMSIPAVAASMGASLGALASAGVISTQNQADLLAKAVSSITVAASIDCPELAVMDPASVAYHIAIAENLP